MNNLRSLNSLRLSEIDTLAFAGGGNRCWWQGGALTHLLSRGMSLPRQLVGTSAGAAVATSCVTADPEFALNACIDLYATNQSIFNWTALSRGKFQFAHQHIYPAWIESFLNPKTFSALEKSGTKIKVGVTRPAPWLGMAGSVAFGTLAYLIDKHIWHSIHPRLPKLFGLRQAFIDLDQCSTVSDAHSVLCAAAAAPPILQSRFVSNFRAIDGGYTDNAPIHKQDQDEQRRTLVLLTRNYPNLPQMFNWRGRNYWQPSKRVPVSTWDCTTHTTVRDAFDLGKMDAIKALDTGILKIA
ncbi:patatin-like phospholipase family protein [Curvibacter sp. AEP1-3]|uniref:patatin-like phospholipase family protein n=1 Tax=Curvibacter sp. AEP1-3 TaxID=1844971 RepID=UPI000B3CCC94|nr:patatin-like phospholipase family protein [Curvibacter sp. AEP1-3]